MFLYNKEKIKITIDIFLLIWSKIFSNVSDWVNNFEIDLNWIILIIICLK